MLAKMIQYVPSRRLTMAQALCDPFFDDVYAGTLQLPNGKPCPEFHFTDDGLISV